MLILTRSRVPVEVEPPPDEMTPDQIDGMKDQDDPSRAHDVIWVGENYEAERNIRIAILIAALGCFKIPATPENMQHMCRWWVLAEYEMGQEVE